MIADARNLTGQPKDYDATGASGKINKHWFCPNCGSSLYTELEVMPDVTWLVFSSSIV